MGARGPAGGGLGPSRAACAASPGGFANFPASLSLRHGKGWSVTERPAGSGTERPRAFASAATRHPAGDAARWVRRPGRTWAFLFKVLEKKAPAGEGSLASCSWLIRILGFLVNLGTRF
ncbi:hypothetical protein Y1Q_0001542 [Alligator mississippiensis]|uniref:Uncharacterized protein n=1 Tax=Alligator mississippiensis TaxID=8496 RepID=A0A151M9V3_ALLMI|nr:hypothetical protein Y1Q_0001542 [Alligator mississippiensis]